MTPFNPFRAIRQSLEWSEIAQMPYTNSRFERQKLHAYKEELKELYDAQQAKDEEKIIDGAFDSLFTAINYYMTSVAQGDFLALRFIGEDAKNFESVCAEQGYDPAKVWRVGIKSNFAKFVLHENSELLTQSIKHYSSLGLKIEYLQTESFLFGNVYVLRTSNKEQRDTANKLYFPHKILKPLGWEEPKWKEAKITTSPQK